MALIRQERIGNTNKYITIIPATTKHQHIETNILLLKFKGETVKVLMNLIPDNNSVSEKFNGIISVTKLNGKFINGYRVEDGIFKTQFVKKGKLQSVKNKDAEITNDCDENLNPDNPFCDQEIDEVVLSVPSNSSNPPVQIRWEPSIRSFVPFVPIDNNVGSGNPGDPVGSPSENLFECDDPIHGCDHEYEDDCPPGMVKNAADECVTPCEEMKDQLANTNFIQKLDELKSKTNQKKESGYMQKKNGTYTSLITTNSGHSLTFSVIPAETMGFIHTHLNDIYTGEIDPKTGQEKIEKPIRMFSPNDIIKFLQIAKNTKYNGIPLSNVYGTMVSSSGTYSLRFTGNIDDISNSFNVGNLDSEFKKYFEKLYSYNKERAFLKFLKDKIGINGIRLYKIKNDGNIEEKSLNEIDKIITNDCE